MGGAELRKSAFHVGDVIRQRRAKAEARIVRIVDYSETHPLHSKGNGPTGIAYIVSLPASQKEALWREEDIEDITVADCS
jgi:hypothetical protein